MFLIPKFECFFFGKKIRPSLTHSNQTGVLKKKYLSAVVVDELEPNNLGQFNVDVVDVG